MSLLPIPKTTTKGDNMTHEDKCSECGEEFNGNWPSKNLSAKEAGMAAGEQNVECPNCGKTHWNWTGEGLVPTGGT